MMQKVEKWTKMCGSLPALLAGAGEARLMIGRKAQSGHTVSHSYKLSWFRLRYPE